MRTRASRRKDACSSNTANESCSAPERNLSPEHDSGDNEACDHGSSDKPSKEPCSNCGRVDSPKWYRGPEGERLCGPCGKWWTKHGVPRPLKFERQRLSNEALVKSCTVCATKKPVRWYWSREGDRLCSSCDFRFKRYGTFHPQKPQKPTRSCANCDTKKTTKWKLDQQGNFVCRLCGEYPKRRGIPRPLGLEKARINKNARKELASATPRNGEAKACSNCFWDKSKVYRLGQKGELLCRMCYEYEKQFGKSRPFLLEIIRLQRYKVRACTNCGDKSPNVWSFLTGPLLCRACNEHHKKYGGARPASMFHNDGKGGPKRDMGRQCSNCFNQSTRRWSRGPGGCQWCHLCWQYHNKNGRTRPLHLEFERQRKAAKKV